MTSWVWVGGWGEGGGWVREERERAPKKDAPARRKTLTDAGGRGFRLPPSPPSHTEGLDMRGAASRRVVAAQGATPSGTPHTPKPAALWGWGQRKKGGAVSHLEHVGTHRDKERGVSCVGVGVGGEAVLE